MRHLSLLAVLLATAACDRSGTSCSGPSIPLGASITLDAGKAYCVKGTGLTVELSDIQMGNTGDNHILVAKVALTSGSDHATFDVEAEHPQAWKGYTVVVEYEGFSWGRDAATVKLTKP